MNKKQRERRTAILEDLVNAQQELLIIYEKTIDVVDTADDAIATIVDPFEEQIVGKDLHDIRAEHLDREDELHHEIDRYYDQLEGKDLQPKAEEEK